METNGTVNKTADNRRLMKLLVAACFSMYTAMMCAKSVFGAELVTFIDKMNTDKFNASLANTYYFLTYAIVQVILAFFMNKLNVRLYLIITVPLAAVCEILVAFASNVSEVWIIFAFSGIFQAGIYAGCMYVLGLYLPPDMISSGNTLMQSGFAIGNTAACAVSALFVALDLWTAPYVIFGVLFILSTVFFGIVTAAVAKKYPNAVKKRDISATKEKSASDNNSDSAYNSGLFTLKGSKQKFAFYLWSVIYSLIVTTLYYSINNWVGNFLKEVYGFSDSVSIVISVIVPVMMFFGPVAAINVSKKHKNFIKVGLVASIIPLAIASVLIWLYDFNVVISIILLVVFIVSTKFLTGLQSVATFDMRNEVNVGAYTAIINATASLAGGFAPTIIGKFIDSANASGATGNEGWFVQYLIAAVIALGLSLLLLLTHLITKNKTNLDN